MRYCPDCGTPHECEAETGAERADVAIARINAERDIKIASYQARAAEHIADAEAEHSAEHAEGIAEGMETALGALAGDDAESTDAGAPIVVDAEPEPAADDEPAGEPDPGTVPPVVEVTTPRGPASKSGWFAAYR